MDYNQLHCRDFSFDQSTQTVDLNFGYQHDVRDDAVTTQVISSLSRPFVEGDLKAALTKPSSYTRLIDDL